MPPRWTGKLWAVKQGIAAAEEKFAPKYLMLTDADIVHAPDTASWLVAHAEKHNIVLTSLTARWRCENLPERVHIPAFIYYFAMLYPFAWVNRPDHPMAGAAGGCMLVRADALRAAGGIDVIRDALIDDCALAGAMKKQGPIWLGLTEPRGEHPPVHDLGRHPPHGRALRLRAAQLFAAAAHWLRRRPDPHLSGSAVSWRCSPPAGRKSSASRLGC